MSKCGIDIIEIERIQNAVLNKNGFLERVFTPKEIEYFRKNGCRYETLAGFFAVKEALSKYLGTGIRGIKFSDIETEHDEYGAPFVCCMGRRAEVSVSISHNRTTAVAVVCGDDCEEICVRNEEMTKLLPKRAEDANKGSCGKVFITAGSRGMTGAAYLAARAALRCGSGLVTVGTPESEQRVLACKLTEAMTVALPCKDGIISRDAAFEIVKRCKGADAAVIGPGLGRSRDIMTVIEELVKAYDKTLIIDADGINALSENIDILSEKKCSVILTPHPGEMSRLTGLAIDEIQADRENIAKDFAEKSGAVVVLKGKGTVIAAPDGRISVNETGNCGMATGGTGDVLSGVIASFAAQGLEPFEAARLGVYIHGRAGDIAKDCIGIHGLLAGDVAEALPKAIKELYGD